MFLLCFSQLTFAQIFKIISYSFMYIPIFFLYYKNFPINSPDTVFFWKKKFNFGFGLCFLWIYNSRSPSPPATHFSIFNDVVSLFSGLHSFWRKVCSRSYLWSCTFDMPFFTWLLSVIFFIVSSYQFDYLVWHGICVCVFIEYLGNEVYNFHLLFRPYFLLYFSFLTPFFLLGF